MIASRYVVILTLSLGSLTGLYSPNGTIQAQDLIEKRPSSAGSDSTPQQAQHKTESDADQELIVRLEKYLTGTNWTGNFVMDGKEKLISERYEILSAKKSEFGDKWNLVARIKYGGHDITLPLPPIEIKFAGKTPVITIDRALIPGLGTFDARVVIRQGKYAGTWKHGDKGGFMFGTIQSMSDEEIKAAEKTVKEMMEE